MRFVLVWLVRLSAGVGWGAAAVACWLLLGSGPVPRPWYPPVVWGGVAVGCAVVRVVALWGLRVPAGVVRWRRWASGGGVSLGKSGDGADWDRVAREWGAARELRFDGSRVWVKVRTGAVWLLVSFAAGAFFAAMMTSPDWEENVDAIRAAGAEVGTATVVREPGGVRADVDDDDVVQGYASRLVVAVPGGAERLTVRGAYTYDKPRKGAEVEVLWARSDPGLGGYVDETKALHTFAAGRWEAFPDDEAGGAALVAFVVVAGIGGVVLVPCFTLMSRVADLQRLAWSPVAQTVRAGVAAGVFLGWRALLVGEEPGLGELVFAGGGFFLVLGVYIGTSMRALR